MQIFLFSIQHVWFADFLLIFLYIFLFVVLIKKPAKPTIRISAEIIKSALCICSILSECKIAGGVLVFLMFVDGIIFSSTNV